MHSRRRLYRTQTRTMPATDPNPTDDRPAAGASASRVIAAARTVIWWLQAATFFAAVVTLILAYGFTRPLLETPAVEFVEIATVAAFVLARLSRLVLLPHAARELRRFALTT